MAAAGKPPVFGKRGAHLSTPPDLPPPEPEAVRRRKRSLVVGLIALGAGSVALSMALSRNKSCEQKLLANPNDPCAQQSRSTNTSSGSRSSSHWIFSRSPGSASQTTTRSTSASRSVTSRGGFGSTGSHFSSRSG